MNKYKEIGERIRHLRGQYTQPEFAKKIGVSLPALQNYEAGKRIPKGDVLARIAAFRNMPVDFILYGEPRKITLDDAREHVKYALWLEGMKATGAELEQLAKQYLNAPDIIKSSLKAAEVPTLHLDEIEKKILSILLEMNKEQKRFLLRFIEGQMLLDERDKKLKGGG